MMSEVFGRLLSSPHVSFSFLTLCFNTPPVGNSHLLRSQLCGTCAGHTTQIPQVLFICLELPLPANVYEEFF